MKKCIILTQAKLEIVQIANKQNKMKNNEKKKENFLLNSFCFNNKLEKN